MKSDDLLKRDFRSDEPLKKCITDITEIKAKDGKLYTSVIFDCFDLSVLGIAMSTNMKAELCVQTLDNAMASYPALHGAIIHSDRGAQYTSDLYRRAITRYGIRQSMNSAGGRCHDNARCESMWARMKTELLYDRYDPEQLTVEQLKSLECVSKIISSKKSCKQNMNSRQNDKAIEALGQLIKAHSNAAELLYL